MSDRARELRGRSEEELARKEATLQRLRERREADAEELARLRARFEAQIKREAD